MEKGRRAREWYSPTQPIPDWPPAYNRNGVLPEYLIDFTPALKAEALELSKKFKFGPIYTPPLVSKAEGPIALLTLATASGGTNWPGAAYDPETHTVYASACDACLTRVGLVQPPSKELSDSNYVHGFAGQPFRISRGPGENAGADAVAPPPERPGGGGGSAFVFNVQGLPIIKPPYGTISAISLDKGTIVWQTAHGETPDVVRDHPLLKDLKVPRTGQSDSVGVLVTKTLVIAGDPQFTTTADRPRGAMLRAYDKTNGKEVGAIYLPAPQSGSPMTYRLDGKQYIVVAVSGGPYSGEYIAFSLPGESGKPGGAAGSGEIHRTARLTLPGSHPRRDRLGGPRPGADAAGMGRRVHGGAVEARDAARGELRVPPRVAPEGIETAGSLTGRRFTAN